MTNDCRVFVFLFLAGRALQQLKSSAWCLKLHPSNGGADGNGEQPVREGSVPSRGKLQKHLVTTDLQLHLSVGGAPQQSHAAAQLLPCQGQTFTYLVNLAVADLLYIFSLPCLACISVHQFLNVCYSIRSPPYAAPGCCWHSYVLGTGVPAAPARLDLRSCWRYP